MTPARYLNNALLQRCVGLWAFGWILASFGSLVLVPSLVVADPSWEPQLEQQTGVPPGQIYIFENEELQLIDLIQVDLTQGSPTVITPSPGTIACGEQPGGACGGWCPQPASGAPNRVCGKAENGNCSCLLIDDQNKCKATGGVGTPDIQCTGEGLCPPKIESYIAQVCKKVTIGNPPNEIHACACGEGDNCKLDVSLNPDGTPGYSCTGLCSSGSCKLTVGSEPQCQCESGCSAELGQDGTLVCSGSNCITGSGMGGVCVLEGTSCSCKQIVSAPPVIAPEPPIVDPQPPLNPPPVSNPQPPADYPPYPEPPSCTTLLVYGDAKSPKAPGQDCGQAPANSCVVQKRSCNSRLKQKCVAAGYAEVIEVDYSECIFLEAGFLDQCVLTCVGCCR